MQELRFYITYNKSRSNALQPRTMISQDPGTQPRPELVEHSSKDSSEPFKSLMRVRGQPFSIPRLQLKTQESRPRITWQPGGCPHPEPYRDKHLWRPSTCSWKFLSGTWLKQEALFNNRLWLTEGPSCLLGLHWLLLQTRQ